MCLHWMRIDKKAIEGVSSENRNSVRRLVGANGILEQCQKCDRNPSYIWGVLRALPGVQRGNKNKLFLGNVKYFAYGSNMHKEDLRRWCERGGYSPVTFLSEEVAVLKDWKLIFNYYSASRGGGAANIVRSVGNEVWGLLVELSVEDYEKIYKKEGAPRCYKEIIVSVVTKDGKVIDDVRTFRAVKERESRKHVAPTKEYLKLLIESAKNYGFPKWYIKKLEKIPAAK